MRKIVLSVLWITLCITGFCQKKDTPYVILVSYDGFRFDYVKRNNLPNFNEFIKRGSMAESLIPSFPSKTFPNHYTLVTGLYTGTHGLIDNWFYDPNRRESFSMSDKKIANDPYYYGGVPIWHLARQHGIKTASFFWIGSTIAHDNHYQDYYYTYNDSVSNQSRVDKVLDWLAMPASERPHLITLYFSLIDDAGHAYGPESAEMNKPLQEADRLLGALMEGVKKTKLAVNVIVVSDHGMKQLTYQEETFIYLDEILNVQDSSVIVSNNGTHAHLYIKNKGKIDSIFHVLTKFEKDFKVYKANEFPERWHYNNPRSGDLLITATVGKEFTSKSRATIAAKVKPGTPWGVHGYDPDVVKEMEGIFYASGPNIKKGIKLKSFRNIHVYPLIAEILGLKTPDIDGSFNVLKPIYIK